MAGHWQTVREAADELGVAPETLTRRMRSGRAVGAAAAVAGGTSATRVDEDAPLPPPPAMPSPRPQPGGPAGQQPQPLPRPPRCTLPPAKPLPPAGAFPTPPPRRSSDASAAAAAAALAARTYAPPRDRIDDAFLAAVEAELTEMRTARAGTVSVTQPALHAAPAVRTPQRLQPTAPVLDMADPLHAQVQDSKKQIRGMWVGVGLLLLAVFAGVLWTTVRMDRAERMVTSLIEQLDAERTLSASYKHEIGRLFQALTDTKANQSKLASQSKPAGQTPQRDANPQKRADGRLTSGK